MRNRARERGLTLIEILIALIIMVLGVLGILALFPPALQSAGESMEDTNAGLLGESVAHALVTGFRGAYFNQGTSKWEVTLTHDLEIGKTTKGRYTFVLPPLPTDPAGIDLEWFHYPSTTAPPPVDTGMKIPTGGYVPEDDDRLFKLGGDGWSRATVDNVHQVNDPTDAYKQFGFSFDIRKVDTLAYLRGTKNPATGGDYTQKERDDMCKLYEVRIYLFRVSTQVAAGGGGGTGGGGGAGGGSDFRRFITVISKRIASK